MFEAIHGSAPRMVNEGRTQFADPSSEIKAACMLMRHIGFLEQTDKVEKALDICGIFEHREIITRRDTGKYGKSFHKLSSRMDRQSCVRRKLGKNIWMN